MAPGATLELSQLLEQRWMQTGGNAWEMNAGVPAMTQNWTPDVGVPANTGEPGFIPGTGPQVQQPQQFMMSQP